MIQLKHMIFLFTYKCVFACDHCFVYGSAQQQGAAGPEIVKIIAREAGKQGALKSVSIFGGEPFLFEDNFIKTIKLFKENKIDSVSAITNGFWLQKEERVKRIADRLESAGLDTLTLSLDPFHMDYFKDYSTYVKVIGDRLTYLGTKVKKITLNLKYTEDPALKQKNSRDTLMAYLQEQFEHIPGIELINRPNDDESRHILYIGRAADKLTSIYSGELKEPGDFCPLEKNSRGFSEIKRTFIDFNGHVMPCPGISIGNIVENRDLFSDYKLENHPVIALLAGKGPKGLYELKESAGFDKKRKFINTCNCCFEIRKHLAKSYRDVFIENFYQEA